ncbi:MAG: hypothetical protein WDN31_01645 [Hyphomicrobium sp.]
MQPNVQRNLLHRALSYERLGRTALAIADYDALIALAPQEGFYRDHRAALVASKHEAPATPAAKARGAKHPERDAEADLECKIYVAAVALTVSVPCAR